MKHAARIAAVPLTAGAVAFLLTWCVQAAIVGRWTWRPAASSKIQT